MAGAVSKEVREFPTRQQRDAWIVEQVVTHSRTLVDVGDELGITRERVRQIVDQETGIDGAAAANLARRNAARTRKRRRLERERALRSKFSLGGNGDRGRRLAESALETRASDEELLDTLRRTLTDADLGVAVGPFNWDKKLVYPDGPGSSTGLPTAATYIKRFGTFHEALRLAGLPLYRAKGEQAHRRSDESLIRDVARFLADPNNHNGGADAYEKWRKRAVPRASSLSLMRSRGIPWTEMKRMALEELGLGTPEALEAFIEAQLAEFDAAEASL